MAAKTTENLNLLLQTYKADLLSSWFEAVAGTYPQETSRFLAMQKDQFANPVGTTVSRELENIFQELLLQESTPELQSYLDAILRVRAVQGFPPSRAVGFVSELKRIVRERLSSEVESQGLQQELLLFEDRIDQLALLAFDIYMQCREKIWELKAKEAQSRTRNLLRKRANVDWSSQEEPS
ncbi:MAG: RsbRD N-terminal domain-containing protein [Desulfohalobiaceae bacterium]